MSGISQNNGVKKPFFRPEKWHGFAPCLYSERHTIKYYTDQYLVRHAGAAGALGAPVLGSPRGWAAAGALGSVERARKGLELIWLGTQTAELLL